MNNAIENVLFGFPKVKRLHLTGEVECSGSLSFVRLCQVDVHHVST